MKDSTSKENNVSNKNADNLFLNSNVKENYSFLSASSGRKICMHECLYEDLLPYTVKPSPITTLSKEDDVWIASSMLSRVSEFTDNVVIMDNEFPIGIISAREILKGILENPTAKYFTNTLASEVMNRKFYLDTRKGRLVKLLDQMKKTKKTFAIIQNSRYDFSGISYREILEVGSMSKIDFSSQGPRKIDLCNREDTVHDILESLVIKENDCMILEDESVIIDHRIILEKITSDLNFLNGVDDFLELNASIFRFEAPKLIPEKLSFPEICKVMLEMKNPYVMTTNRIWTPSDVLDVLVSGVS